GWKVPETTFWLYENDPPVGYGKIRHFLTERLQKAGGNIGYAIRPSARGRGLGNILLKMLIDQGGKLGVNKFLLTIHESNEPSIRVALAGGGVVEKQYENRCYIWIEPIKGGE
ncbi:MAG: GNAT family N-acetyltransferase, partial [Acetatifactor sp.]|nr:GNAT family N-acetyltransferase [Acetatifactor sp.]